MCMCVNVCMHVCMCMCVCVSLTHSLTNSITHQYVYNTCISPINRDGLLALSILPCTINICVAQTLSAGGNMGTAIFNAIFANVMGASIIIFYVMYCHVFSFYLSFH